MAEHLTAFYEFGPFRLDVRERSLLRGGEQVALTPRTFETLLVLVRNRDRVVEKQELMDTLWPDSDVEENNLNQSISAVRKALGERAGEQRYIKTITRLGYRFVAPVLEVRADPDNTATVTERQDPSPSLADEYQGTTAKHYAEPDPARGAPQIDDGRSDAHGRRFSKRTLIVAAVLALCAVTGVVLLRTARRSEEYTNPSEMRVVSAGPYGEKVEVEVWWPKDRVRVSGMQPFKAIATGLPLHEYTMFWQVDGDRLSPLANNYEDYPHKEVLVDLSGWNWRGSGPYKVNFVARDRNGTTLAEREVNIYVTP